MRTSSNTLALSVVALSAWSAAALSGCADQPKPNCITFPDAYALKFFEEDRDGACEGTAPPFGGDPRVGVVSYYEQDDKKQPDYRLGSIAIQSAEFGNALAAAEGAEIENSARDGERFALGAFTAGEPDDAEFCSVPELAPAHLVLDEVPAVPDDPETEEDDSVPGQPALDIRLEWSNVQVYVTPASVGTQLSADLVDARTTPDGETCTIRYRVLALAPAVDCKERDKDTGEPILNDDGSFRPDSTWCDSEPDPSKNRFLGSGISADAATTCDPETFYCVVSGDSVPSLK
ncbi:MAG: hypothetical protein ABW321_00725 [Polyangiales bacterium]